MTTKTEHTHIHIHVPLYSHIQVASQEILCMHVQDNLIFKSKTFLLDHNDAYITECCLYKHIITLYL